MAKILVVEDDAHSATYISTLLLRAGHLSVCARSATEARGALTDHRDIAIAILDHDLGANEENGRHLLASLRQGAPTSTLPVIVCTSDARREVLNEFIALGVDGFVKKPFRPERLLAEIIRVLES